MTQNHDDETTKIYLKKVLFHFSQA